MDDAPFVVVGGGMAGGRAAEFLAMRGKPAGGVVLIGDEPRRPYHRPVLSKQLLHQPVDEDRTYFRPESFYASRKIDLRLGIRAVQLAADKHTVVLGDGQHVRYEKLILAPGTTPVQMSVPGTDLAGIHYLRTMADAEAIRPALESAPSVVVVGGGFIGTEVATGAAALGHAVTIVELMPAVLTTALSEQVGALIERRLTRRGVQLRHGLRVAAFHGTGDGTGRVAGVELIGGEVLPADLVVIGIGVRPDIDWLAGSGLELRDGIVVDEYCRTSLPDVYAAGDAAHWCHSWFGELRLEHETNAQNQAMAAARNAISAEPHLYRPIPYVWSDQGDLAIRYLGHAEPADNLVIDDSGDDRLNVAYVRDEVVRAVLTVNDPDAVAAADKLMQAEGPFPLSQWQRVRSTARKGTFMTNPIDVAESGPDQGEVDWHDERVAYQLTRAREQAGEGFDVIPLSLTLLLHRAAAALVKASQFDLEPLQLTSTQFNVLTVLHRAEEPLTMRALSDMVSIRPPNLTTIVDQLMARKLVAKNVSQADRRSFLVAPTAQGHALMSRFLPSHWRFMSEFYAGLDRDEQVQLARLLDRLLGTLKPDDESPLGLPSRIVDAALSFG
jgi:3-phenylpropionate/trans-cinnamate dioxygenase ferredoxin reductase subunit